MKTISSLFDVEEETNPYDVGYQIGNSYISYISSKGDYMNIDTNDKRIEIDNNDIEKYLLLHRWNKKTNILLKKETWLNADLPKIDFEGLTFRLIDDFCIFTASTIYNLNILPYEGWSKPIRIKTSQSGAFYNTHIEATCLFDYGNKIPFCDRSTNLKAIQYDLDCINDKLLKELSQTPLNSNINPNIIKKLFRYLNFRKSNIDVHNIVLRSTSSNKEINKIIICKNYPWKKDDPWYVEEIK